VLEGGRFEALEGPLDASPAQPKAERELAEAGLRGCPSLDRDGLVDGCQRGETTAGFELLDDVQVTSAGGDRSFEVGALGVEDTVEVPVELAHDEAGLDLEDTGPCATRPQERQDRLGPLPGEHRPAAALASAGREAGIREATRQLVRLVEGDDELEMRATGSQAQ
jgi:hypothetical protein